jgi:hypothetical protein
MGVVAIPATFTWVAPAFPSPLRRPQAAGQRVALEAGDGAVGLALDSANRDDRDLGRRAGCQARTRGAQRGASPRQHLVVAGSAAQCGLDEVGAEITARRLLERHEQAAVPSAAVDGVADKGRSRSASVEKALRRPGRPVELRRNIGVEPDRAGAGIVPAQRPVAERGDHQPRFPRDRHPPGRRGHRGLPGRAAGPADPAQIIARADESVSAGRGRLGEHPLAGLKTLDLGGLGRRRRGGARRCPGNPAGGEVEEGERLAVADQGHLAAVAGDG